MVLSNQESQRKFFWFKISSVLTLFAITLAAITLNQVSSLVSGGILCSPLVFLVLFYAFVLYQVHIGKLNKDDAKKLKHEIFYTMLFFSVLLLFTFAFPIAFKYIICGII